MANNKTLTRDSLAELIGTFMLVLVGAGAGALGQPVVVVALAHGLILIAIIYTYGHISGAHVNPAVTLALLVGRQIDITRAVVYWVVQFLGAIIAALVLKVLIPVGLNGAALTSLGETTGSLTTNYPLQAYLFEAIFTFFLASVVMQAAVFKRAGNVAGVGIGVTLAACILFGGPLTGGSLNPARTLGPALIAGNLSYVPGYLLAMFAGGALAGLVQNFIFESHQPTVELTARPPRPASGSRPKSGR